MALCRLRDWHTRIHGQISVQKWQRKPFNNLFVEFGNILALTFTTQPFPKVRMGKKHRLGWGERLEAEP